MPLPAGMLTIGDADSDIAVTLEHGARVTLSVDDDGVRLLTAAPLWVDGVPVASPDDNCGDDGAAARPPSAPDTSCLPLHASSTWPAWPFGSTMAAIQHPARCRRVRHVDRRRRARLRRPQSPRSRGGPSPRPTPAPLVAIAVTAGHFRGSPSRAYLR